MAKKFSELTDKMSTERKKRIQEKTEDLLNKTRPSDMDFMDEDDPFIIVDGRKELPNEGGMIKES